MTEAGLASEIRVRCPRCRREINLSWIDTPDAVCPLCRRPFEAIRFEPPVRAVLMPQMADGALEAAQPCAVHPLNAAVASCERCGSFICALCRIDVDGRTLCPTCFERLSTEGSLESTRTTFRDFPGLAGVAATIGCLGVAFFGVLLGPLAIYYAIKGLRQKKAMGESDGRVGLWLAILLGVAEIGFGIFFLFSIFLATSKGVR